MSNTPNDPFDPNRAYQNPLTPEVVGGPGGPGAQSPVKKKWPMVLAIVLGLGFVSMVICCGVLWYAMSQVGGLGVVFEPVKEELNRMPAVTEEIGEIESMSMNFGETVNEAEENPDFIVFDLEGTSGSAKAAVKVGSDGGIEEAILILPDGTRKELDSSNPSATIPDDLGALNQPIDEMTIEDETERELRELESSLDL
ncbi:hypothetical protein [Rhodopirellula bahusiensis]|uniref:Uncharacterized protein n=1 Tax=Rhodopirellula bahusiensis TaxID=2014065 RepID=A0A2G1WBH9_9BACT|nr:hypothetical protein [Rhodopirellula bahusiensis]PHQ35989.1 hypothetical protein CEE69_07280 [Rhodopirellula bahusiensis]